jgi:N-acetylglucosaminyl-diphospho-decaprenol L-rhamnosyltransferase
VVSVDVAVLVVCWNNKDLIEDCLNSVEQQDYPADHLHTYVIDNASSDGSEAFVRQRFPDVNVLQTGRNSGFAIANNLGIEQARIDHDPTFFVLLDAG